MYIPPHNQPDPALACRDSDCTAPDVVDVIKLAPNDLKSANSSVNDSTPGIDKATAVSEPTLRSVVLSSCGKNTGS